MPVTNQPLQGGYQLLNYRNDRQISRGGFSIVYRAFDETGAPVAMVTRPTRSEAWIGLLGADPRPGLLEADEPSARLITLTELLDRPADDPDVVVAHRQLLADPGTAELTGRLQALREKYRKLTIDLELLNEDVQKFNSSFDFGVIAAQIEAMEGGAEVISGGLLSSEREELSTRMRFKRQRLTEEEAPPPPALPPLAEIRDRLLAILEKYRPSTNS